MALLSEATVYTHLYFVNETLDCFNEFENQALGENPRSAELTSKPNSLAEGVSVNPKARFASVPGTGALIGSRPLTSAQRPLVLGGVGGYEGLCIHSSSESEKGKK
ncbi:hypothetical protein H6G89_22140 [Oscillatoria sp. FACHB-1407]|uniref:hypothetical protein n=1 Tax=Oscillatoria sp. FACHB-1407 TaxID=2692847 RepID=UPI001684ED78|nr:hypothetical protein [Oscillatoria sp. FACHB-1407]MBD2463705.1 hypothetical protein [Oscillatoria sp. FACHB-1407]